MTVNYRFSIAWKNEFKTVFFHFEFVAISFGEIEENSSPILETATRATVSGNIPRKFYDYCLQYTYIHRI